MRYHPFRNIGLKVLAIALAVVLWLTIAGEHVVERSIRVPLEFRNVPQALEIVGATPDTVDVRVRGSSALLSRVQPGEIVAVLDLATARPGPRLFAVRADEVRAPFGIEVAQVLPATLSLDLEKSARRSVPVIPMTQGDPAPGYVVTRKTVQPATVTIVGPETRVRQVSEATTEPVSVEGATGRVRDTVNIGVIDSSVRLAEPQSASVAVDIAPAPIDRQLSGIVVKVRNLAGGRKAQVTPASVRVTIRGPRDGINTVNADAINAFVDLAALGTGRYNLRVQVDPSETYGVTAIDPAVVSVTIR
jgi:YbbR domain-containing protein